MIIVLIIVLIFIIVFTIIIYSCRSEHEILSKPPPLLISDEDSFRIQHSSTGSCVDLTHAGFSLAPCNGTTQLWKWGSGHRLFHVSSSLCLALDVRSKNLSLVDCGTSGSLSWRCQDGAVYTSYEMFLTVIGGTPGVKRNAGENWLRAGSQENICHRAYRGTERDADGSALQAGDDYYMYLSGF